MLTIRPYRPADWPRLQQIHDPARRNELALAGMPDAFRPLAEVAEEEGLFDYPHLDVAEVNGTAAGFAAYTDEELGWVYVDPAFSRKGIGRALLRHALEAEPDLYYIEVLAGNVPALALYESEGFVFREALHGSMPGNESFKVTVDALIRPSAAFTLGLAAMEDAEAVFSIIRERIRWMDEQGIRQWNAADYWAIFPESYYRDAIKAGRLLVLRDRLTGKVAAAGVYAHTDGFWNDLDGREGAGYIHNFAASRAFPGAGSLMLEKVEGYARREGRAKFRLDCRAGNARLNAYYESRGYQAVGEVRDGGYHGIRREKKL